MKKLLLTSIILFLSLRLSAQNQPPVAVNDYASITNCDTFTIYPLINDYDLEGDSIWIMNLLPGNSHLRWGSKTNSTISILLYPDYYGIDSIQYRIASRDSSWTTQYAFGWIYLNVQNCHCVDSININNINARINNNGNLFWDLISKTQFEVPKGSGKSTIFMNSFWIGGKDSLDSLHLAGERYQQYGNDFWPGPVSNIYDSAYDSKWNKLWKIHKSDIDYHLAHCWQPNYIPAQELIDWPGNGDTILGQLAITAPFKDWNNDGIYDPYAGDFPLIKGDEAIYFIYNDDRLPHTETGGNKLRIEIHVMAYEFACEEDSALWNTIFLNYKIFNRSAFDYFDTYTGFHTDFNLGDATDDYISSDVQRGSFYIYNGDDFDGTGKPGDYGKFPPAQSLTVLAGPFLDPDGFDNPSGQCDEGINGLNFGNNIQDDERLGLNSFCYYCAACSPVGCPYVAADYYNYLQGKWKDSTNMLWGGNAYVSGPGVCGPECNFMFPGDSDPCNWGTDGQTPNCTPLWTEETIGNTPYNRRGIGSIGSFTFKANSMEEVDIAFVFGRDYVDSTAAAGVAVMQQRIDSIRKYFVNDSTPCGLSFSGITPTQLIVPKIKVFPNPAIGYITVDATGMLCDLNYIIYDILGREVSKGRLKCTSANQIFISGLENGMYIINVSDGEKKVSRKFIKQ